MQLCNSTALFLPKKVVKRTGEQRLGVFCDVDAYGKDGHEWGTQMPV